MGSKVLFAPLTFNKYDPSETLPRRFERMVDKMGFDGLVSGKLTVIKMHVGRHIGYSTIHPLFVKILVDKLKALGAKVYIADQEIEGCRARGYTEEFLGCPIVHVCGITEKYFYPESVDFKKFKNVDIGGVIRDAEVFVDLSHVKGHGVCGYGGAVKNIAMGCVTDRTRAQIHSLEGGIDWDKDKCTFCEACITSCNHYANSFKNGEYRVFLHHCTFCQHCVKVCPTGAISMDARSFRDFQTGMAICTQKCLEHFDKKRIFYINFMMNITALCDCWGLTTPAIVPDIGICASKDIIAVERACLDMIKVENFIPAGIPKLHKLSGSGHLLEQIHGKNPFIQLEELEKIGMGSQEYTLEVVE